MKPELLRALLQIIKQISSALTLEQLYVTALKESLVALDLQYGSIALISHVTDLLHIKASVRNGHELLQHTDQDVEKYQGLAKQVIEKGGVIHWADVHSDAISQDTFAAGALKSVLCAPIAIGERIFGIISIESPESNAFDLMNEQFLILIGEQIALAIESHMLRDISTELSKLSVENILSKIAEVACFLFAARSSAVLADPRDIGEKNSAKFPSFEEKPPFIPRPNGLTYQIVNTGKPVTLQNVQENPDIRESTKQRGIQAILGVPLQISRQSENKMEIQTIGALLVDILENRPFSEREQILLQSLANQASIAIEKERHTRSLHYLNQITLEIASSEQDIHGLSSIVVSHAAKLVNAKGGRLCLLDETGTAVQDALMTNSPGQPVKIKLEATGGVFGRVLKTQRPFTKTAYQHWPDRRRDFDKYGFTAVAGVPIIYQDHLWGVILVHDTMEGRIFDQEDLELLANLGNLAAVAFSSVSRFNNINRMIENTAATVIALDHLGHITQFNQQAEEMLQYKKEEVLGTSIKEIYYYKEDPHLIKDLMMDSPDGCVKGYTTYLRSKKRQRIPIKLSASLLFDYDGKVSGSVGFFHDQRRNQVRIAIAGLLDKDEIFQVIVNQAWDITGASHSAHLALNIENKLQVTVARPPESLPMKQLVPIDIASENEIGISGRAFKTGEPQLVGNVTHDPDYIPFSDETRSELAVPIKTQEDVIGVIDVQHPKEDAFNETDLHNLETLAQFAAIAIKNAQLYAVSQIEKRKFETIADITRDILQSLNVNQLLRSICYRLENIFSEKDATVSIRLYDQAENILRFEPQWHESFHLKQDNKIGEVRTTQSLAEGICGFVARKRRPKMVGNVHTDPDFLRLIANTNSEISIPIQMSETQGLIGVLDLQSPLLNAFTLNDLEYLQLLAGHLAVGIDKAKLKKGADFGKILNEAAGVVASPLALGETLNQITKHVYELAKERGKTVNSVVLRVVQDNKRILVAAQPPKLLAELQQTLKEVVIAEGIDGRVGISGRAILTGKTQNVDNVDDDDDYMRLRETTRSELAIPIIINAKVIAAMTIECIAANAFVDDDVQVFEALAAQAGIAIHSTYQYNILERKHRHQQAIYRASYIISRYLSLNHRELLDRILEQAVEIIQPANGTKVNLGAIHLYDAKKNEIQRESIYPKGMVDVQNRELGVSRSINRAINPRIGINGRAIFEEKRQRVYDVREDPDYLCLRDATRSELDVLIFDENYQIVGVLGLESDEIGAFDEEDENALISLANLAGIAIRNTQQYQLLQDTKDELATQTAIAWLGATRGSWEHKMTGHIAAIFQYVRLIEGLITAGCTLEELTEPLSKIKRVIDKTREKRITTPLSPDEGREWVSVEGFMRQWIGKIDEHIEPEAEISYQPDISTGSVSIYVNPGWFKLAIDNIANNALRAMKSVSIKHLTVTSLDKGNCVEILIHDTGPGIPAHIQKIYGINMIRREQGAQGEGIGLMLTNMIIHTYGGEMGIRETGASGTSIFVRLPCESTGLTPYHSLQV